jgi:ribonuclease MRP protein subunit RMP1
MPTAVEELSSISQVLSATNHRNKNQHRLAKWWKAFSVLRRNIIKLVLELETLSANDERLGKTKKKTIESREAVERRTEFMVLWVVPKCYL